MKKKIVKMMGGLLFTAMLMAPAQGACAEMQEWNVEDLASMKLLYVNTTGTSLRITDGKAELLGRVSGKRNITTKITIKLILQKYSKGNWKEITDFSKTENTHSSYLFAKYGVTSGKYRVKGVFTTYSGVKSEQITEYSSSVSC